MITFTQPNMSDVGNISLFSEILTFHFG